MQASGQHGHAESDIELCIDDGDGVIGASQRVAAQPGYQRVSWAFWSTSRLIF